MPKNNSNNTDWDKIVRGANGLGLATTAIVLVDKAIKWWNEDDKKRNS